MRQGNVAVDQRQAYLLGELSKKLGDMVISGDTPFDELVDAVKEQVDGLVDSLHDDVGTREYLMEIMALSFVAVLSIDMNREVELRKKRRMFYILGDNLQIAPESDERNHAQWLAEEGDDDSYMEAIRGHVDASGVYAYKGLDFSLGPQALDEFGATFPRLATELQLDGDMEVWAGFIPGKLGQPGKGRSKLGKVSELCGW